MLFGNKTALENLPNIKNVLEIGIKQCKALIENDEAYSTTFGCAKVFYQVDVQGISKEGFLLAFLKDVTEIVRLNEEIEDTQKEIIYAMGEIGETPF